MTKRTEGPSSLPAARARARMRRELGLGGIEVTDGVFGSRSPIVFNPAESRTQTIKALLNATIAG